MPRRALIVLVALVAAGVCAAVALAAQPKSEGFYGGTFKNGKNYVNFLVDTSNKITVADVQYVCKGKSVIAPSSKRFRPRRISSTGAFSFTYKSRIISNDGHARKVARGRVTIRGRFVTRTRAKGTARVKSTKCPKRKQGFVARGPQIEG
jgi:hypothetical protein